MGGGRWYRMREPEIDEEMEARADLIRKYGDE